MYPMQLLVILLLLTAGALAVQVRALMVRRARLRGLASREKMQFSPIDRFGLAPRVAKYFPIAGVADVRVFDLLYRSDEGGHRYVFTVDYTRGVLCVKRRVRGVALMTEPRIEPGKDATPTVRVSDASLGPVFAQYESLLRK